MLTQARERFYPVDAYLLDLVLLDAALPAGSLADLLAARIPVQPDRPGLGHRASRGSLIPTPWPQLRTAVTEGWADVAGGAYAEIAESLSPITSILWQFRKGAEVYRSHLDDRNVETLASRRFALYPQRAQVARRSGFRFALHLGLDSGRFPIPSESKRLWESPDGSQPGNPDETACRRRPRLRGAAPRLATWPEHEGGPRGHRGPGALARPVAGWFQDFRRMNSYSPVLARLVTAGDYFHLSDRPWEMFRPKLDDYMTPYLEQAVARGSLEPISGPARHAARRARWMR